MSPPHKDVLLPEQLSTKKKYIYISEGSSFVYQGRLYSFILASEVEQILIKWLVGPGNAEQNKTWSLP